MKVILHTLVVATLVMPALITGQNFGPNVRVNDDPVGKAQRAPVLRIGPSGTLYVSWIDFRTNPGGDIYLAKSTDGGNTFGKNAVVSAGGSVNSDFQRAAYFAVDSKEHLHFVWMESRYFNQPDIFYSRSTDGGSTFSQPKSVSGDSSRYAQDFPSIAMDGSDNISICFLDAREKQSDRSENVQLYFTRSTDGGDSFSQPVRASMMPGGVGGTCECCRTDMVVSHDGIVTIAFRTNINNRRDIFIARSLDRGLTFETAFPAASEPWYIDACPVTGPSIILDRYENAHIAWRDARHSGGGSGRIYYTTLFAGASKCEADMRLSDGTRKGDYPSVAVSSDGIVLCAYQESRSDPMDLFYRYSVDGGNAFTPSRKLTDETGSSRQEFVSCIVDGRGVRYAAWQDSRFDAGDIFFTVDTTQRDPVFPGKVTLISPPDNSRIPAFTSFTWNRPGNIGAALHVRYDLTWWNDGGAPSAMSISDTSASPRLADGSYRWFVTARSAVGSSPESDTAEFLLDPSLSVSEDVVEPAGAFLYQNHPNPFFSGTSITFGLHQAGGITLSLVNAAGREVRRLYDGWCDRGLHTLQLDASGLRDGIYFCRLIAGRKQITRTIVLLR